MSSIDSEKSVNALNARLLDSRGLRTIARFIGEFRWLSNFWPAEVVLDGISYPSVEHAYQAAKTFDENMRREIRAMTAGQAKRAGRRLVMRPDWDQVKLDIMLGLVAAKFMNNPELGKLLLATGDDELVEGNDWGDRFWGVCNGAGMNNLGKILMAVRTTLRSNNQLPKR